MCETTLVWYSEHHVSMFCNVQLCTVSFIVFAIQHTLLHAMHQSCCFQHFFSKEHGYVYTKDYFCRSVEKKNGLKWKSCFFQRVQTEGQKRLNEHNSFPFFFCTTIYVPCVVNFLFNPVWWDQIQTPISRNINTNK